LQAEFVAEFEQIRAEKEEDEVHYFVDAVHPTLNSEASYGWIEKGSEHQILSNSGRTRMNILGAINTDDVTDLITGEYKTINFESAGDFFEQIGKKNPEASKIKVFIDNAGYFKKMVAEGLVWLPTYSPNLNLIERLWKFLKKKILKNNYHGLAKGFREKVREFFRNIKEYKTELKSLLTCNFRLVYFSQSIY
jgi:transposase